MVKRLPGWLAAAVLFSVGNTAHAACSYTYTFASGTNAVASQMNQDLNDIVNCVTSLAGAGAITGSGGVGIGTTTPVSKLEVAGDITALSGGTAFTELWADGAIVFGTGSTSGGLRIGSATNEAAAGWTEMMRILNNGNVGIGTPSPSYALHVNGTAYATGAAGALSDRRHKTAIEPYEVDALGVIARLRPITFAWKEPKDDGMKGRQIGFIAQDVEPIIPEAVLTMSNAEKTLGLRYDALIPVLTRALQQQQAEIAELTAAVRTLQSANDHLRQRVADIRNNGGGKNPRRAPQ